VGRLSDEAKNIEMLRDVNAPLPIYVAGERQCGTSAAPRQIGRSILLGELPQSSLLTLLARSSIYIATPIYEPFGIAPLEAALCGCAVIANDIPSLREVWGDDALYFDGPRSLSMLLHQLNRDEQRLAEARQRSFAMCSSRVLQRTRPRVHLAIETCSNSRSYLQRLGVQDAIGCVHHLRIYQIPHLIGLRRGSYFSIASCCPARY
jgi:glycosyltransferase involved in cell wall biosynthesis